MEFTTGIHSIKGILLPTLTIAVTYIIGFANTSSCQWDLNKTPVVYQIGDTLVLNCTYTGQSANLTRAAILDPHGNPLQIHHMTESNSIVATNEINDCSQGGTYVCMPDHCGRTLRNVHTIRVEDSSRNPDLACVYNSYYMALSNITCKWRPNCEENYYQWSLLYRNSTDSTFRPCATTSHRACVIPDVDTHQYETYELKLVQMEYLQPNRTFEYVFNADQTAWRLEILLNNITSIASDELNITLFISERVRNAICMVQYTSEWEGSVNQVNYTVPYTPSLRVALTLDGLEAFTTYNISVRCRPARSKYWSKPIHAVYRTLPTAPNGLPGRIVFADEIKTSGRRQIYFYWTPLPKRQRRGYLTEYTISYLNDGGRNGTDFFPSDTVTAMLKHTVPLDDETAVLIGSRNEAGISSTSKMIIIPAHCTDGYQTVVVSGSDTSNITAVWGPQSVLQGHQRSLVYYWCNGSRDGGRMPMCDFPLQSKVSTEQTVTVNNSNHGNMNFGISLPTDGQALPKIEWSKCIFTNTVSDSLKAMDVSLARHNSTTIAVKLNTGYCDFDNMPALYQVASYETRTNCSEVYEFMDFAAVPSLRTVYIPMVHPKRTFVCFRVLYKNGLASNSGPFVIDLAKTGPSSESPAALIVGMALLSVTVLFVLLILLARLCRSRLERLSKIEDVTITVSPGSEAPDADSGPYMYTDSITGTDTRTCLNDDDCYDDSVSVVNDVIELQERNDEVPEINNEYFNSSGGVITYTSINHHHEAKSLTCMQDADLDLGNEKTIKKSDDNSTDSATKSSNTNDIIYSSIEHNADLTQTGGQSFQNRDNGTFDDFEISSLIVSSFKQSNIEAADLQVMKTINNRAYSNDQYSNHEIHIENSNGEFSSNTDVPLADQPVAYLTLDFNPSICSSHTDSGSSSGSCVSPVNSRVQSPLQPSSFSTSSNSEDTIGLYVMSTRLEHLPDVDTRMSAQAAQTGRIHLDVSPLLNTRTVDASSSDTSSDSAISSSGLSGVDDYVASAII